MTELIDNSKATPPEERSSAYQAIKGFLGLLPSLMQTLSDEEIVELRRYITTMKDKGEYSVTESLAREQLLRVLLPVEQMIADVRDPELPIVDVGKELMDVRKKSQTRILPPHVNQTSGVAFYNAYTYLGTEHSFTNGLSFNENAENDRPKVAVADIHETFHQRQYLTIPATSLTFFNTDTPVILTPLDALVMDILLEAPTSAFEVYMSSKMDADLPGMAQIKNTITGEKFAEIRKDAPSLSAAFEKAAKMALDANYTRDDVEPDKRIDFLNYYASHSLKAWISNYQERRKPHPHAPLLPLVGQLTTDDTRPFCDIMGVKIFQDMKIGDFRSYISSRLNAENLKLLDEANALLKQNDPKAVSSPQSARHLLETLVSGSQTLEQLHQKSIAPALSP